MDRLRRPRQIACATYGPIVVVFSLEVVHHRILGVNKLVDVSHEVADGMCVSFVDLLEELDVTNKQILKKQTNKKPRPVLI